MKINRKNIIYVKNFVEKHTENRLKVFSILKKNANSVTREPKQYKIKKKIKKILGGPKLFSTTLLKTFIGL